MSANRSRSLNVSNLLFGNILGVSGGDLLRVSSVALSTALVLAFYYKQLVATTHNSAVAAAHGVRVGRIEALFNILLAVVVVTALQVLGVLLVAATLLLPAATASLLVRSFAGIVACSIGLGVAIGIAGLYVSFYQDIASGPAIVLCGAALFAAAVVAAPVLNSRRAA
jgi:ABC-type Mn2+/Zn2+ transport system permease subunit